MGGDELWLARELRALVEAQAAEKAEQGCEKAACPTAAEAPVKAEKGPPAPAPAPVRASAARRAPGAPWDDVDDALEAVAARSRWLSPAQAFALLRAERGRDARLAALPVRDTASPAEASAAACYVVRKRPKADGPRRRAAPGAAQVPATFQGLVRPVPVSFQSVVNSYVHWLEEHPTIGVAVCKMSRSKRKPHRSRERKELLEDGYDESQDRIVSHGLTGRIYKLVVRGQSPKPDAPGEAPPAAAAPELPAGPRVRCEKKPTRGGACEALEGSSIVQIFIDEAAARFVGPARSRQAPRPFRPPPPADYPTPRRFAVPAELSYGGTGYGYDAPRLAAHYAAHFPYSRRGGAPRPDGAEALRAARAADEPRRRTLEGAPALGRDPNDVARHVFEGAPAPPRHLECAGRAASEQCGPLDGHHPAFFDGAPQPSRHPEYPDERRGADPLCLFFDGAPKRRRSQDRAPSDAPPPAYARRDASPGDPFSPRMKPYARFWTLPSDDPYARFWTLPSDDDVAGPEESDRVRGDLDVDGGVVQRPSAPPYAPQPAACYSHPYVGHRPGIISQVPLRPGDPAGQAAAAGDVDDDSWPSFSHLGDADADPLLTHLDDVVDDSLLKADAIDGVLLSLQKPFKKDFSNHEE